MTPAPSRAEPGTRSVPRALLVAVVTIAAAAGAGPAAAQLARVGDSVVDTAALIMTSTATYGRGINGASFQTNALQTIGGYQYTAWYTNDANASVMLARRSVSGTAVGPWDAVNTGSRFTNGKASADAHNVVSFGVAGDGSIHMAWDMHNNNLRYRRTAAGVATTGSGWGPSMFQPEQATLMPGEATVTSVTYPNFVTKPGGGLLLAFRRGGSGNGDNWLYDYDGGTWRDGRMVISRSGTFTDVFNPSSSPSTSRNAYWNGYDYGPDGTLFTTWTWRESTNQYANHDICFAASADGGFTWGNNAGASIGDTRAARPITLASPGTVVQPLDRKQSLINQQAQIVMGDGSVHAVMYHRRDDQPWTTGDAAYVPSDCSYYDYVRDPLTGVWSRHEIPGLVGTRAALARSADDTLYAVVVAPGTPLGTLNGTNGASGRILTIAAAHKAAGWGDWTIVHRDYLRNFADEPRVDAGRLLADGVLSVYVQENTATAGSTGTPLRVIDFVPAAAEGGDGWLPTGGGSWTSAANWSPAGVPNSGTAAATIGYRFQGNATIALDAPVTVNQLVYLGASGTIAPGGGGTLTFGGSNAVARIDSAVTVTAPVGGGFTKTGGGMLLLGADNTAGLAGRTVTVAGGQLVPGGSGSASGAEFGTATTTLVVQPGGQIWLAGLTAGARTFPQTIRLSGSGAPAGGYGAIVNDGGTATLSGPVIVDADATIAAVNNGAYVLGGGSNGFTESTAGRSLTFAIASGTSSLAGSVAVSTVVKQGTGVLRWAASDRVIDTGTVRVDDGTLDLGGGFDRVATLALTGGTVASGTLAASAYDLRAGGLSAVVTGSGAVRKTGAGTVVLSGSAVAFTGTTTVTGGVLAITSTAALPGWNVPGRFAVSGGATLSVPASFSDATVTTLVNTGNFAAGGRVGLVTLGTARTLAFGAGAQGALGLLLGGTGTVTASSTNAYTGGTVLAGGLVRVSVAGGLGSGPITITGSAARVALTGNVVLANDFVVDAPTGAVGNGVIQYEGAGTGRISGGTVTVLGASASGGTFASTGGGTLVVDDPIVAAATVPVSMRIGTTIFTGGGSYSTFLVNEGIARLGRTDGLSTTALVTVAASAAATLDLAGYDQTLAGLAKGPGAATVGSSSLDRDATLTLSGSSTYAGTLQDAVGGGTRRLGLAVAGGWLRLSASNAFSGTASVRDGTLQAGHPRALGSAPLRVLSGGTLAVTGTLAVNATSLAVAAGGLVDLGSGSLVLAAGGIAPGDLVAALRAGRRDGDWQGREGVTSSAVAAAIAGGADRTIGWRAAADGSILVTAAAAGDATLDGLVDVLDVADVMASGLYDSGGAATWASGDFNYDGLLDILDASAMLGAGLFDAGGYRPAALAAVPEPVFPGVAALAVLLTITAVRSSACRVPPTKPSTA